MGQRKVLTVHMFSVLSCILLLLFIRCNETCNRSVDDLLIWIKNDYDGSVRPNSTGKAD